MQDDKKTGFKLFFIWTPITLLIMAVTTLSLVFLGLPVHGLEWLTATEKAAPTKTVAPTVVNYTSTPAAGVMRSFFGALNSKYKSSGIEILSAGVPMPLDCVQPAPSLSKSQSFVIDKADTQVVFAAYPAGTGQKMFERLNEDVNSCKPASTSVFSSKVDNLGVNASKLEASWSINHIETTMYRRGDVIIFLSTSSGSDSVERAKKTDAILKKYLTPEICPSQDDPTGAFRRNPLFAKSAFTGNLETKNLTTEKLDEPDLTIDQVNKQISKTALPAKDLGIKEVVLPVASIEYPLWPNLPKQMAYPAYPKLPTPQKLESSLKIRTPDVEGPGCGWSFLTTLPASYDTAQVNDTNKQAIELAQQNLDGDGKRWQNDVTAYWTAYDEYVAKTSKYVKYIAKVEAVRIAWEKIDQAWIEYKAKYETWKTEDDARLQLIEDQATAQATYDSQVAGCNQYTTDQTTYPTRVNQYNSDVISYPTRYNSWTLAHQQWQDRKDAAAAVNAPFTEKEPVAPKQPVRPEVPVAPIYPCPPVKDPILSQKVPKAVKEPVKPADPRPADQIS